MIRVQNNGQSIDYVQPRWTFYFVQTNFRSTSHFDRTCKLYTCMDLKLMTRKIKHILTSLHHYNFVETDTLFLEWLTFHSMGKWCVARFKLYLGCNQDGCLFYGFLPCLLFFRLGYVQKASRRVIKKQQKLREYEVMF